MDGSDRQYIRTGRWRFDAEGSWKGHDARLSVTFLMSAGQRRAGSQSAHPDDSIRIQACSEWRPRILSTLRVVRIVPPRRAGPLPRPSKRYNRSSISREIPAPLVRVAPRCSSMLGQDTESRSEFLPRGTKPFTNITNFPPIERGNRPIRNLETFPVIFLFKSSSSRFERKCDIFIDGDLLWDGVSARYVLEGYFIFDGIRMIEEARPDSNIGGWILSILLFAREKLYKIGIQRE